MKYKRKETFGKNTAVASLLTSDDAPQKKLYATAGVKHKAMDDPEFNTALEKLSKQYGINKDWVNRLIQLESGGDTTAKNKSGSASGIIQMIDSTARGVGTTAEDLRKMTATEQLPFAFKYWDKYKGKINQPTDLYIANMYPKALGKPDDYKLEGNVYAGNKALDKDKKGYITVKDIRKHFDPNYTAKSDEPMMTPKFIAPAVADKTFRQASLPGKNELFAIQKSTLPSLGKKEEIKYPTGIRSADQGNPPPQDISTDDLVSLYEDPSLSSDPAFIQRLFGKKQ